MAADHTHIMEYSASEIRKLLQELFPHRRLVLSQFTFFNQVGVARPTGETFRRRRRCYKLLDVLPIACVLALKEEGIPLKNIDRVPSLIQEFASRIFQIGRGCRISGVGSEVQLLFPGDSSLSLPLDLLLGGESDGLLFWGFDVGLLADQLVEIATRAIGAEELRAA